MCAKSFEVLLFSVLLTSCRLESRLGFQGTFPSWLVISLANSMSRLILGGGYGFLTSQHGLAVDNLLQVCSFSVTSRYPLLIG